MQQNSFQLVAVFLCLTTSVERLCVHLHLPLSRPCAPSLPSSLRSRSSRAQTQATILCMRLWTSLTPSSHLPALDGCSASPPAAGAGACEQSAGGCRSQQMLQFYSVIFNVLCVQVHLFHFHIVHQWWCTVGSCGDWWALCCAWEAQETTIGGDALSGCRKWVLVEKEH